MMLIIFNKCSLKGLRTLLSLPQIIPNQVRTLLVTLEGRNFTDMDVI